MIVTIHQPDFLPWFGFFNKVAKADLWIVLDHVENNPRDAAFWGRRVKILVNGEEKWLSIPLDRQMAQGRVGVPIREMRVNTSDPRYFDKCRRTVSQAYARAPFFADHEDLVTDYFESGEPLLMARNMRFIEGVMERLGIETRIVYSSSLDVTTSRTQLLVDLLQRVQATTYLCGGGASGYQEDALYDEAGIQLQYNHFQHPRYEQPHVETFHPGLSIIDALFSVPLTDLSELVHDE